MSKFVYRMQNILNIKEKMESQAKMEYATARIRLTEEEEKQEKLVQRKESYLEEGKALRNQKLNVREIQDNKNAILRMDDYIQEQQVNVMLAERNLEEAREKLTEVMQERKTQEKLREKAFEVFLQEEKARESKEIDELTSYTYGQKLGD